MNLKVNPTVGIEKVFHVVLVDKVLGYVGELDAYIFRAVQGWFKIEVLDVKSYKFCVFAVEGTYQRFLPSKTRTH